MLREARAGNPWPRTWSCSPGGSAPSLAAQEEAASCRKAPGEEPGRSQGGCLSGKLTVCFCLGFSATVAITSSVEESELPGFRVHLFSGFLSLLHFSFHSDPFWKLPWCFFIFLFLFFDMVIIAVY